MLPDRGGKKCVAAVETNIHVPHSGATCLAVPPYPASPQLFIVYFLCLCNSTGTTVIILGLPMPHEPSLSLLLSFQRSSMAEERKRKERFMGLTSGVRWRNGTWQLAAPPPQCLLKSEPSIARPPPHISKEKRSYLGAEVEKNLCFGSTLRLGAQLPS